MVVVAPFCQYKKTNFKIYIVMLLAFAAYLGYDGYLSKYKWSKRYHFYEDHVTKNGGKSDTTMKVNRYSPPFMIVGAIGIAVWYRKVKDRKLIADDEALVFSEKDKIPYNSIEGIKDNYKSKGFFVVEYKLPDGRKSQRKISDRNYDNLDAVLELLVSKITS
jgi:hypothetical protein